jgi:hypothetical protein
VLLLVPADPLRPRRPDPHFADEARSFGSFQVVDPPSAAVSGSGPAVYRGWMLSSATYAAFHAALAARGVVLETSPADYRRAHELPGWYASLVDVTPRSVWTVGDSRSSFDDACRALGGAAAVLRDYTKSMKHYWHEAAYIPDVSSPDRAWAVASRFRELREEDFTGGFVLRAFEEFSPGEVRTWWRHGRCVFVGPHPDGGPTDLPSDVDFLAPLVASFPFVTVDLARRVDGVWRVVELGDGQVSDRPRTVPVDEFVHRLWDASTDGNATVPGPAPA